jgi:hypothetical protein
MRHLEFPYLAVDRAEEQRAEADEAYEAALAAETARHEKAIRANALTGHEQTLGLLAEQLQNRLVGEGVTEHLIRAALTCGTWTAGQLLLDLIGKCIADHADAGATVELAGGMDFNAMRAAAPAGVQVPA